MTTWHPAPFNLDKFRQAKTAAGDAVLGLTLTTRIHRTAAALPMAGFPYHQLDCYVSALFRRGYRVAVLDQMPA